MNTFIKKTFINREYSWLMFNQRVLQEAEALDNPLLERCKFLSIFTSNLDEFFMVRAGALFNDFLINPKVTENKTGLTPEEQLDGIYHYAKKLYAERARAAKKIWSELKTHGIDVLNVRLKNRKFGKKTLNYFKKAIFPLLNPIVLDTKHPLIHLDNLKMYVMLRLHDSGGKTRFGILPVPDKCERIIAEPGAKNMKLMTIEDLVYQCADEIFAKYKVMGKALVRITSKADFEMEIDSVDCESEQDYRRLMKGRVAMRHSLPPVRLEMSGDDPAITDFLCKQFNIARKHCFTIYHFFDYKFLFDLDRFMAPEKVSELKYEPFKGRVIPNLKPNNIIDSIRKRDIFLSYPFDSMDTYMDLLDAASSDSRVVSIKITIYRLDKQSRIVEALCRASRNGKDVTVIIELTARFDEENNLHFSQILSEAGCTVIYGVGNYKVHSKITLIVLRDKDNISYITHTGTGNYNVSTSKQYTDLNVITADYDTGSDGADFFRNLAMGDVHFKYKDLLVAPGTMKEVILQKIKEQTELAQAGKPCGIICKMNSLTDLDCIKAFIKASNAGVKISLIIRGICCLLPGVTGKTENITVKSIVGRFLEHSRIYCFGAENPDIYISSADLMTRNVSRRVEIASPVKDKKIAKRIKTMLDIMLADNEKARYLTAQGKYVRLDEPGVSSQQYFLENSV